MMIVMIAKQLAKLRKFGNPNLLLLPLYIFPNQNLMRISSLFPFH